MEHYFTNKEEFNFEPKLIDINLGTENYRFYTHDGVFSKNRLDYGSRLLIAEAVKFCAQKEIRILDMGCGIGIIGIALALENKALSADMVDISKKACMLAELNVDKFGLNERLNVIHGDKYNGVHEKYDLIVTNPPIRTGKENVKSILLGAKNHLLQSGALMAVIRKDQGALSYVKILKEIYTEAVVLAKSKGFFIIKAFFLT